MILITRLSSLFGNLLAAGRSLLLSTKPTRRILARLRKLRAERKLKKSGYKSWEHYRRWNDPDTLCRATRVKDFYHGYKYVHCFEDRNHYAYELLYDYGPGGIKYGDDEIVEWLDKNAKFTSRIDMHRVIKCPATADQWEFNDLGGGDYIFVAFKEEKDYMMFLLRWS